MLEYSNELDLYSLFQPSYSENSERRSKAHVKCLMNTYHNPVKSSNDKKDYKCIRLSNGLTALLVSDTSYDLEKLDEEETQLEGKKEISISRKF